MSKLGNEASYLLVQSLTKAEKRHFKLKHNPKGPLETPLFVQLFDAMDKMKTYEEKALLGSFGKKQLPNLKRELYFHVLGCLRDLAEKKDVRLKIRQMIDYAQVLYNKGLYQQALKLLNRAKSKAIRCHEVELKIQILEFEKVIEARHITRSIENRAEQLRDESHQSVRQLNRLSHLSNLALSMYGQYIKKGHVRSREEAVELKKYFEREAADYNLIDTHEHTAEFSPSEQLSFYEKINLYQAHSWYAYILQDFPLYYRYVRKWVHLFEQEPQQKKIDAALYLKAMNNLLTALFFIGNGKEFDRTLAALEAYWEAHRHSANENTKTLAFVYLYTARFNKYFMEGTFDQGLYLIQEWEKELKRHQLQIDPYRILVFYYKIASLYFGSGENTLAIKYLNKIINLKIGNLKADIQCFARILLLITHYELKHFDLLEYLLPSTMNFLEKNKEMSGIFIEIVKFLRRFDRLGLRGLPGAFIELKHTLTQVAQDPYERRFLLYLDVISWLESKIEGRPVQAVIHDKFMKRLPRI